jgi:23S rRNA G2069 N7-methylase RlmK/C1962 C5-methylase RlmI
VTAVDSSKKAMDALLGNIIMNNLDEDCFEMIQGDCVEVMRKMVEEKREFDIVICDPPKLAPSRATLDKATNKYKKINSLALSLVKSGGTILSCTCSSAMTQSHGFLDMVESAAKVANKETTVLSVSGAAPDHPVLPSYPEGKYLTAIHLYVI